MLETIRRFWIGILVLALVAIHGGIVVMIRHQASMAKIDASCEVDLGVYLAYQPNATAPLQMRLHAIVPLPHRMKSRQLIDLNRAQIRQAIEEHLRQIDRQLLVDPFLADLKSQVLDIMVQTIGKAAIEDLVITEVRESLDSANLAFVSRSNPQPHKLVATLRAKSTSETVDEEETAHAEAAEHGEADEHADSDESGHGEPAHAEPAPKKDAKKEAEHGAAKKPESKPSSSHGSEKKKSSSKETKKSGH